MLQQIRLVPLITMVMLTACQAAGIDQSDLSLPQPQDGAIRIGPEDDFNAIVAAAPAGTRFLLAPGNYRGWSVTVRDRQSFEAEGPGVVLDGSIIVTGWTKDGSYWIAEIPPAQWNHGQVREGSLARLREDLFIDEALITPVGSLAELGPGKWYRDGTNAYLAEDPSGRLVELGYVDSAFAGEAEGVVIKGITVRQYAPAAQHGAIEAHAGRNWQLIDVVAEYNHSRGLSMGPGMLVRGGSYSHNGQLGIGGGAHDVTIENTEIGYNNYAGYQNWWEAGGLKITKSDNLVLRGSYVHHNDGPGVWLDWDNRFALIEDNLIFENWTIGLQYEASRQGTVRDNIIARNNQSKRDSWFWGAELLLQNSGDIEVTGNTIVVQYNAGIGVTQQDRRSGDYGEHLATNNRITDNTIIHLTAQGGSGADGDHKVAELLSTTLFDGNRYIIPAGSEKRAYWARKEILDWDGIRATGWEKNGRLTAVPDPSAHEPDYEAWRRNHLGTASSDAAPKQ